MEDKSTLLSDKNLRIKVRRMSFCERIPPPCAFSERVCRAVSSKTGASFSKRATFVSRPGIYGKNFECCFRQSAHLLFIVH
jgi:hypothetical protein